MFGATAETLSKASMMVFRIGTDAHLYDDPDDVSIAPLLDSKFDLEKREALKRLLALTAQGLDVSNFFTQVVKNVASQSLEVKKLVYLYLLHYAEKSLTFYDNVPTLVPMEEIASLEPSQTIRRILQVRFHHHILPLKLALFSDGKKLPVKLRPDIGYFVKPLPMDVESLHG